MLKPCPACEVMFEDGGFGNKVYCSVRCRNTEKIRRAVARDKETFRVVPPTIGTPNQSGTVVMTNPTGEALALEAEKYLNEPTRQPMMIKGTLPKWVAPDEIMLGPTGLATPDEIPTKWLMCHKKFME